MDTPKRDAIWIHSDSQDHATKREQSINAAVEQLAALLRASVAATYDSGAANSAVIIRVVGCDSREQADRVRVLGGALLDSWLREQGFR